MSRSRGPAIDFLGSAVDAGGGLSAWSTSPYILTDERAAARPTACDLSTLCELSDVERLQELNRRLLQATDSRQLLDCLLDAIIAFEEADLGMIQLPDRRTGQLLPASQRGFSAQLLERYGAAKSHEQSISERAFRSRGRIVVENVAHETAPHLRRFAADAGFCSAHCAPIIEQGGIVIGTLTTFFRSSHRATAREARLSDLYLRAAGDVIGNFREKAALRLAHEAAERASESKARTLAVVSHDLRQPLQALALLNSALRRLCSDASFKGALEQHDRAIAAASGLLNSLLDLHGLESGSRQPLLEDFAPAELLDQVHAEFAATAARKGLELQLEACTDAARSDRILVGQILRNLVSNAIRYTAAGHVRVRCSAEGDSVRIEVIDTGIGIPPDAIPRLFEELYQVSTSTTREGHGIGLSIVHRIARLLNHEIGIRSTLGYGSVFTLVLPRGGDAHPGADCVSPAGEAAL